MTEFPILQNANIYICKSRFQAIIYIFSWAGRENLEMTPPTHGGAEDNVKLLLTKNPARSFSYPWCQVHGISFERFPWPWQTVGPVSGPSQCVCSLAFFKRVLFRSYAVACSLALSRLMNRRVSEANCEHPRTA